MVIRLVALLHAIRYVFIFGSLIVKQKNKLIQMLMLQTRACDSQALTFNLP